MQTNVSGAKQRPIVQTNRLERMQSDCFSERHRRDTCMQPPINIMEIRLDVFKERQPQMIANRPPIRTENSIDDNRANWNPASRLRWHRYRFHGRRGAAQSNRFVTWSHPTVGRNCISGGWLDMQQRQFLRRSRMARRHLHVFQSQRTEGNQPIRRKCRASDLRLLVDEACRNRLFPAGHTLENSRSHRLPGDVNGEVFGRGADGLHS